MLDDNELLFDELYEKTKDCGRVQFINLLMEKERENQELKEQLEVGKEQYNDLVEEKENLQEQLDYLRGGEYLNQLRFERDMLQHVVDTNGVPSEVYDYLDCTHRNTELLEESQELKKQLEDHIKAEMKAKDESEKLRKEYQETYKDVRVEIKEYKTQQKEFIEWLEKEIEAIENKLNRYNELVKQGKETDFEYYESIIDERKFDIYMKTLRKYKEIIGDKDE